MSRLAHTFAACLLLFPAIHAEEMPMIDCHVHLFDITRTAGVSWIAEDDKVLRRSFLPADHEPIAKANGVTGVVLVQAGQDLPDNQWNLDITAPNKALYRGVVGNLSLVIGTPEFKPLFEQLCKDPRYLGYRISGRYQEKITEAFYEDLRLTAEKGKSVDFLLGGYSLEEISVIADRVPELRIFGSDWPVTGRTGDYASVVKLTKAYFDPKGPAVSEKLFSKNAIRFYSITESD